MNDYKRKNGRLVDQIREVSLERDFVSNSDGSVLISQGNTQVLCTANIENKCPLWLKGTDRGWITAEYSCLLYTSPSPRDKRQSRMPSSA